MKTASKNLSSNTVSLKELRENFPKYIEAIATGQNFTVVKRSKPIFQIGPVADEGSWQTIADFTQFKKQGLPAEEILDRL